MKTRVHALFSCIFLLAALSLSVYGDAHLELPQGTLIYQDDFSGDLSNWVVEQMDRGTSTIEEGRLVINDIKGCTVWFRHKLSGPVLIEYEVTMVDEGGKFDRVSDLNCFWMAVDPKNPEDIFANKSRNGAFKKYHPLRTYYVGYGGNNNSTTRLRRYPGGGPRPLLPEHDLKDARFMNVPNKTVKIQIVANEERIQFLRDGEMVFDFEDNEPYTEGWFGFRTVRSHMRIDNFKVFELSPE